MDEKTTIEEFKKVMIELYRGYPTYVYFGKFEYYFGKEGARKIIERLDKDGLIEVDYDIANDKYYYELTKKGMDFAIAMVNLNFSQKIHKFSKIIVWLTIVLALIGIIQIITSII